MKSTGPDDLRAIGDPIAAELLPGWRIAWEWCRPEDIGGSLAMVYPDPKREMARIMVAPHPENEDITESLAHEIVHGTISPLVELIEPSAAEVGIEERIVERLGVLIARLWKGSQGLARASLRRGVATYSPVNGVRFRARISMPDARRKRTGGSMVDAKMLAALALEGGALMATEGLPPEAAAWIKKAVEAMAGSTEPDGDEAPATPEQRDPARPAQGAAAPAEGGGGDGTMRQRARAQLVELEAIAADARRDAKTRLIDRVRSRVPSDHKGLPAVEKRILAAQDYAAAKSIADVVLDMLPESETDAGNGRARGTDGRQTAQPDTRADTGPEPEDLKSFDPSFQAEYRRLHKDDPKAAEYWISSGRARFARDKAQGRS